MRIIGASWGRTGTTSLAAALERLGAGPVCHMHRVFAHPDEAAAWAAFRRGDHVDLAGLLDHYGAGVDWPACWAWERAARLYPDATVLLSVRDPDEWYASVRGTIHPWTDPDRVYDDPGQAPSPEAQEVLDLIWETEFGGWEAARDERAAIAAYENHVAHVRSACPPDRLLEWSVRDGWEPLCEALGVPVPDEPFPHLNRRESA